jgi:MarR-like DNA-binding transcriptional regulator SgrR of sgrS sRNA
VVHCPVYFRTTDPWRHSGIPGQVHGNIRNILRFGVHVSEMGNLDPHFAAGSQDRALADMVFNGLLRYQPGGAPQIEPDLAVTDARI